MLNWKGSCLGLELPWKPFFEGWGHHWTRTGFELFDPKPMFVVCGHGYHPWIAIFRLECEGRALVLDQSHVRNHVFGLGEHICTIIEFEKALKHARGHGYHPWYGQKWGSGGAICLENSNVYYQHISNYIWCGYWTRNTDKKSAVTYFLWLADMATTTLWKS